MALQRIVLRRGTWFFTIRASDPALTNGFHDFEGDHGIRWTNGDAELPATHLKQSDRPTQLVLVLGGIAHYVDDGFPAVRAA